MVKSSPYVSDLDASLATQQTTALRLQTLQDSRVKVVEQSTAAMLLELDRLGSYPPPEKTVAFLLTPPAAKRLADQLHQAIEQYLDSFPRSDGPSESQ